MTKIYFAKFCKHVFRNSSGSFTSSKKPLEKKYSQLLKKV